MSDKIEAAFLKKTGPRWREGKTVHGTFKLDDVRFIQFDDMSQRRFDDPGKQRAVSRRV